MKRSFLLLVSALLSSMAAWSADGDQFTANTIEGVEMTFEVISEENKTCMTAGGNGYSSIPRSYEGMITVPAEVNGYKVIEVGYNSFCYCENLRMVTISEGIETIGYAFYRALGLKTLVLPKSFKTLRHIGGMTSQWESLKALEKVVISDLEAWCNTSCLWDDSPLNAAHHLYLGEEEITDLVIPTSVTNLGEQFAGCTGIETITIHKDVTRISSFAFWGCSGVSTVTISEENANYDSRNNCNAIIETGTNTLLFGCKSTQIPSSVTSINNNAFYGCTGLTAINIPNSVTAIGSSAFNGCTSLTSITIPSSVTAIGNTTFYNCISLTSVTIPSSVTSIGGSAFEGCTSLTSVTIPSSVTSIGGGAFKGCTSLTSVTIPSSVTSIGGSAFRKCTGLTSVSIPSSVTSIGNTTFYNCTSLTSVTIPSSVTAIGYGAFIGCTSLTSVSIPSSVTTISSSTFEGCTSLTSVTIPSSVTSIGESAFKGCTSLTSATISSSVNSFGFGAFGDCTSLTSVTVLSERPVSITQYIFTNRANATLFVPTGCKSVYEAANYWKEFKEIVEIGSSSLEINTIDISSAGIRTFSSSQALDFSGVSGLKAYIVSGFGPSTGKLTLTPVTEVPAGEGLLLKGAEGSYEVPYTTTDMYYSNLLTGVTTTTDISPTADDQTNFILADGSHGIGFYTISETGPLAAGKAYLHLPTSAVSAMARCFILDFENEEATGIVELEAEAADAECCFDLQGRRVLRPSNGIYIVNGKKVFIK